MSGQAAGPDEEAKDMGLNVNEQRKRAAMTIMEQAGYTGRFAGHRNAFSAAGRSRHDDACKRSDRLKKKVFK